MARAKGRQPGCSQSGARKLHRHFYCIFFPTLLKAPFPLTAAFTDDDDGEGVYENLKNLSNLHQSGELRRRRRSSFVKSENAFSYATGESHLVVAKGKSFE